MSSAPQAPSRAPAATVALAARINAALPQTQCTRCGYPDCAGYAQAIAAGEAAINQCPPGGAEGIARLAAITGLPVTLLSPEHGVETPRSVAFIDEAWCIGCTLCIKACPTDAIVGSNKVMHTVIEPYCTGCELCIPVCPVDCIELENVTDTATGWDAWSAPLALQAQQRHAAHRTRVPLDGGSEGASYHGLPDARPDPPPGTGSMAGESPRAPAEAGNAQAARQAAIATAMERARQRRLQSPR